MNKVHKLISNVIFGSVLIFMMASSWALSADDMMTQSWQVSNLFESKQYTLTTNIISRQESSPIVSHKFMTTPRYSAESVHIPGLGTIRNGVYDVTDETHLIFYTDGVVVKLDY